MNATRIGRSLESKVGFRSEKQWPFVLNLNFLSSSFGMTSKRKPSLPSPVSSRSCPDLRALVTEDNATAIDASKVVNASSSIQSSFSFEGRTSRKMHRCSSPPKLTFDEKLVKSSESVLDDMDLLFFARHEPKPPAWDSHLIIAVPRCDVQKPFRKSPKGPSPMLSCTQRFLPDESIDHVKVCDDAPRNIEVAKAAELASKGLKSGYVPILADGCSNGAYYMRGPLGRICAIFKPMDEEAGAPNTPHSGSTLSFKGGIHSGDGAVRECAAFLVDGGFAGVPPTAMASVHINGSLKTGSLQVYVTHDCSAEDMGPRNFSKSDIQAIAILDIRLCNQDRHLGNLLVTGPKPYKLVPIDHGYCLPHPDSLGEADFAWLLWPQAHEPLDLSICARISSIDPIADAEQLLLLYPSLPRECLLTLRIGTMLLQYGVLHNKTLFEIGSWIVRKNIDEYSELEKIVEKVCEKLGSSAFDDHDRFMEVLSEQLDELVKSSNAVK